MTIEDTVHGILDVLSKSHKPQDIKVAKELYGLYNTRSPYIWTRVRTVKTRTPKTETPQSPSVIIDALQALTVSSSSSSESSKPASASQQQQGRFVDLEYQQDIICTLTKALPSAVQVGQPNRVPGNVVPWAIDLRQLDITAQGAKPSTPWMFFSLRQSRFGRPGPGQQQYRPRTPQQHQQPYNQARPNVPDTQKPQNTRHTPQPNTCVDNPGQQHGRRWTRPSAPHAQPQAPPTAPTTDTGNRNNNNQRTSGRKPKPAPSPAPGPGPQQQQQRQGKQTDAVLPAEKEILVSSAN